MPHLDSDRLIQRALTDEPLTEQETDHLDGCETCRVELAGLRHVSGTGRHTQGLDTLPMPPARIWDRIQAELATTNRDTAPPPVTLHSDPPRRPTAVPTNDREELRARRAARHRRTGPSWATTAVLSAAAAAVAIVITLVIVRQTPDTTQAQPCVGTQQVRLEALPGVPAGVTGFACLHTDNGQHRLRIHAEGMPAQPDGDYEAWLLDATSFAGPALRMEALGVVSDGIDHDLTVPSNLDLSKYKVVDISAEPHDGNAAHSGHSLLRGTL